ncbi:glycosyltransferase family 1 protein [Nordella sp. HKS 07]|uniref:glycosyltransferase family 4 protein n=1 Tax=Nordella sp. HKS 07 TaxID=2712222 RepID=UPI0013E1E5FF|nr:glycosyltransferase family 1 protein [Nordella sp. HKS 07]QIG51631.1 glycosyltransferase family 1 protein [Nordella sp. HKS 07]
MRIAIVTDAWSPQVNGVVRTLRAVSAELERRGHVVHVLSPEGRRTVPMPYYPEIRLALTGAGALGREIEALAPDAIYIATEGPLGWAARSFCRRANIPFTSGFHTRFADYLALRLPIPGLVPASWSILRDFHKASRCVLVPTRSIAQDLERRGFGNLKIWTRGVDHMLFQPGKRARLDYPRPIMLHAGRLAPEKNIEAFLKLDLPGTKLIVGDGPQRRELERRFPDAVFLGFRFDRELARFMASADVFVFPSLTDTFGLVMLEAMASGTPVAAFDVPSPVDVVKDGVTGALDKHLKLAILRALTLDRDNVHEAARGFTWEHTADIFEDSLRPVSGPITPQAEITTSLAPSRSS